MNENEIEKEKKKHNLDKKLKRVIKEIILYFLFLYNLYIVAFNNINDNNFRYKTSLTNLFSKSNIIGNMDIKEVLI